MAHKIQIANIKYNPSVQAGSGPGGRTGIVGLSFKATTDLGEVVFDGEFWSGEGWFGDTTCTLAGEDMQGTPAGDTLLEWLSGGFPHEDDGAAAVKQAQHEAKKTITAAVSEMLDQIRNSGNGPTAEASMKGIDNQSYKFYVVVQTDDGSRIDSGWEYQEDAKERQQATKDETLPGVKSGSAKVLTRRSLDSAGMSPKDAKSWLTVPKRTAGAHDDRVLEIVRENWMAWKDQDGPPTTMAEINEFMEAMWNEYGPDGDGRDAEERDRYEEAFMEHKNDAKAIKMRKFLEQAMKQKGWEPTDDRPWHQVLPFTRKSSSLRATVEARATLDAYERAADKVAEITGGTAKVWGADALLLEDCGPGFHMHFQHHGEVLQLWIGSAHPSQLTQWMDVRLVSATDDPKLRELDLEHVARDPDAFATFIVAVLHAHHLRAKAKDHKVLVAGKRDVVQAVQLLLHERARKAVQAYFTDETPNDQQAQQGRTEKPVTANSLQSAIRAHRPRTAAGPALGPGLLATLAGLTFMGIAGKAVINDLQHQIQKGESQYMRGTTRMIAKHIEQKQPLTKKDMDRVANMYDMLDDTEREGFKKTIADTAVKHKVLKQEEADAIYQSNDDHDITKIVVNRVKKIRQGISKHLDKARGITRTEAPKGGAQPALSTKEKDDAAHEAKSDKALKNLHQGAEQDKAKKKQKDTPPPAGHKPGHNITKPPQGYTRIPGSKHGYHKKKPGGGFDRWYPPKTARLLEAIAALTEDSV